MNKKILAVIAAVVLVACASIIAFESYSKDNGNDSKGTIYVTMSWEQEMVEAICGNDYTVISFVEAGSDPHGTDATPSEIAGAADADVYFYIGSGIEWETTNLDTIKENIPELHTVDLCGESGITLLEGDPDEGEETDPHVWTSPSNLAAFAEVVLNTLTERYPEDASMFETGYEEYKEKCTMAETEADEYLSGLSGSEIVIWHPAWSYLFSDYSIRQLELKESVSGSTTPATVIATLVGATSAVNPVNVYVGSIDDLPLTKGELAESGIYVNVIVVNQLATDWIDYLSYAIETFGTTIDASK